MKMLLYWIGIIVTVVALLMFNGWWLMCVYRLGIDPLCSVTGYELPAVGLSYFILLHIVVSCVKKYLQKTPNKDIFKDENSTKQLLSSLSVMISGVFNKMMLLLMLVMVNYICF